MQCLVVIQRVVEDCLKLKLNPKTAISPLSVGIDYLGARYYLLKSGKIVVKLTQKKKKHDFKKSKSK